MPKPKPTMSPEDRQEMNEGIARAIRLIGGEPKIVAAKTETHAVNLGSGSGRHKHLTITPLGKPGHFAVTNVCDTCKQVVPLQLRVMPDGSVRDQPRCGPCRTKQQREQKKYDEIPF